MSSAANCSAWALKPVKAWLVKKAASSAALAAAQPSTTAFRLVEREMMSANSGSPATEIGAPGTAAGCSAARATAGLDIARAIVRARPQDMEVTSCFSVRWDVEPEYAPAVNECLPCHSRWRRR